LRLCAASPEVCICILGADHLEIRSQHRQRQSSRFSSHVREAQQSLSCCVRSKIPDSGGGEDANDGPALDDSDGDSGVQGQRQPGLWRWAHASDKADCAPANWRWEGVSDARALPCLTCPSSQGLNGSGRPTAKRHSVLGSASPSLSLSRLPPYCCPANLEGFLVSGCWWRGAIWRACRQGECTTPVQVRPLG
jgi:hypothetical protein